MPTIRETIEDLVQRYAAVSEHCEVVAEAVIKAAH